MQYRGAKYIDTSRIDCEIHHPDHGWIPYTLDPSDVDTTVDNQALLLSMRVSGNVAAYQPPSEEERRQKAAEKVRQQRESKLVMEVDPIAGNTLRWASLSQEQQEAWAEYRNNLLDITNQTNFPYEITWPTPPQ